MCKELKICVKFLDGLRKFNGHYSLCTGSKSHTCHSEHRHLWLEGGGDADTNAGMEKLEKVCSIRSCLSHLSWVHV